MFEEIYPKNLGETELDLSVAHFKGFSLHVVFMLIPMLHVLKREVHRVILFKLADLTEPGVLNPVVDTESFSLKNVGLAHNRLASKEAMEKVVISIK